MRATWWTPRAVSLHVTLALTVPGFLYLGWWQLHRALGGNGLSWAYTFEWPFFCVYAVVMWWRLVHDVAADRAARDAPSDAASVDATTPADEDAPRALRASVLAGPVGRRRHPPLQTPPETREANDSYDAELDAYNRYLAELNERGEPKRW